MPHLLTKSRYMIGLQCAKYLWIALNSPQEIPEHDEAAQHRFEQGNLVGELATTLFPEGISVPHDDFNVSLKKSYELLSLRKPLFEAAFLTNNLYARADILEPQENDGWNIIEVKSATKIKSEHLHDLSFQKYCYQKAGLKIEKCFLMHINNEYVRDGEIDTASLFTKVDVTEKVNEAMERIRERIEEMFSIINSQKYPDIPIGPHCSEPYDCPVMEKCWALVPQHSVFDLYRGTKKAFELFQSGVVRMADIGGDVKLTDIQKIQLQCVREQKPHIEKKKLQKFLEGLHYPLHYFDFETFGAAVPLFDGTWPYQQIPFQFSLHIDDGSTLQHYSFIASDASDPREALVEHMKKVMRDSGSIVVYNQSFEKRILGDLAQSSPQNKEWIESLPFRFVDLLEPFREFSYYHPNQNGSASIKAVLPVLTDKKYSTLKIANGETASIRFLQAIYGGNGDAQKVRADLEKYCAQDTEGMKLIVERLRELAQ